MLSAHVFNYIVDKTKPHFSKFSWHKLLYYVQSFKLTKDLKIIRLFELEQTNCLCFLLK